MIEVIKEKSYIGTQDIRLKINEDIEGQSFIYSKEELF